MTQKELSYVEDAIGHEGNLIKILEETKKNLEGENLVNFIDNEINSHTSIKERIMTIVEDIAHE